MKLFLNTLPSPLGDILLVTDDEGLVYALDFHDYQARMRELLVRYYGFVELTPPAGRAPRRTQEAIDAIGTYFEGNLAAIKEIETADGGTEFQRTIWRALRDIPAGMTLAYGELAARIGRPTASRAVGMANGANPIALIVPCHRVVGADGSLTGYGGGMWRKQWLLEHEGVLPAV